jgi:hypothetical protein
MSLRQTGVTSLALTFNNLLGLEGLDPARVVLVRHRDAGRQTRSLSLYGVWKAESVVLEAYQAIQQRRVFEPGELVASFVVTPHPENATLFVGLYSVDDVGIAAEGSVDPVFGTDVSGMFQYALSRDERLSSYVAKLWIAWGAGARSWRQRGGRQDKRETEIRSETEPAFPGFAPFESDIEEVERLPSSWVDTLRNVKGVYLLVDRDSGKQYVGSALGQDSLWGRWCNYARDGHGGDTELRKLGRRPYRVTILQAVPMIAPDDDVLATESVWKEKLMTRKFGLNAN